MKGLFAAMCSMFLLLSGHAEDLKYPAFMIPDSLKENANAVIREDRTILEIASLTHTRIKKKRAITVLCEKGRKLGWEAITYDKDKKIIDIKLKVFNALGKEIDKWKRNDFEDISYDPWGTTYTDSRMLIANPVCKDYPYTVEYTLVYERYNTYILDNWYPVLDDNISIVKSSFIVSNPKGFNLKFKEKNSEPIVRQATEANTVEWTLENFKAIKYEAFRPSKLQYAPYVNLVLEDFRYGNYEGSFNSWNSLGKFISELNENKGELPPEKINEIKNIANSCTDENEKVKKLYEFMQSHTRYISIQVGIGGLQPLSATTVAETGYGDCKALSNYMMSILKYAGIKSYYTLVNAGSHNYYFDPDFVHDPFNHIILCVPLKNDTVWLECTSQTMPCGFLGDFTDNRPVLLITENGGVLTKTPNYTKEQNLISRNALVEVNGNGTCSATLTSNYSGLKYDNKHNLSIQDKEEQLKILYKDLNIPNFKITGFTVQSTKNKAPRLTEEVRLELNNYASKSGSRLFLPVNIASNWTYVPKEVIGRKFDVYKKTEGRYMDTIRYKLPQNYSIEVIPEMEEINNKYGKYKAEITKNNNELVYIRELEINSGIFPAAEYADYINFFKTIRKNDGCIVVLKEK